VTKLNQIIAIEKTAKSAAKKDFGDVYQTLNKVNLTSGITRTYQSKDDEGETLPSEIQLVQINVADSLKAATAALTRLFDVTATKETANTSAKADVVVEGKVLLSDVPVTYLLFLERELVDLKTFVSNLPTLDPAFSWNYDENTGVYESDPVETTRTKKIPKNWVKAEATDKHPAQVEIFHEDVIVGTWKTIKMSGAIPATRRVELLTRVQQLSDAVAFARETANNTDVSDVKVGAKVFSFLFA